MKTLRVSFFISLLAVLSACAPSTQRVLGTTSNTYQLREGLFERSSAFLVQNADTDLNVYQVDPSVVALRDTLVVKDVQGPTLGRIVRKVLSLTPTFELYRDDALVATLGQSLADGISNALIGDRVGDRYTVSTEDGSSDFEIRGNVFDLNYEIYRDDLQIGNVSQGAFFPNGRYFVEVAQDQDDVLVLQMVMALNELTKAQRERNNS